MERDLVGHWAGELSLSLRYINDKTVLRSKHQVGPYTVQRAFYPEPSPNEGVCHLILLHPPGGLVEGDSLVLSLQCGPDAQALVTTPSAGKAYLSNKNQVKQTQSFVLAAGAGLEWFPQETILYQGSKSCFTTTIDLSGDARFAGWELMCMGRDLSGDHFERGCFSQAIELRRDGKLIFVERMKFDNARLTPFKQRINDPWGFAGRSVFGSFLMTGANEESVEIARACVSQLSLSDDDALIGITLIEDVLVCRGLAYQSRWLKKAFTAIWSALRAQLLGRNAYTPRIWNT